MKHFLKMFSPTFALFFLLALVDSSTADSCQYTGQCTKSTGWWFRKRTNTYSCRKTASCATTWEAWTECSHTCNGGTRTRRGTCKAGNLCSEQRTQTIDCNTHNCPRDGNWSDWGPETCTKCTATCGPSNKVCTKTRTCSNPSPAYNGADCTGSASSTRTLTCSTSPCPIHGGWTSWSPLLCNECSNMLCSQTRTCSNPAPQYGGRDCTGDDSYQEYQSCSQPQCHANGGWSEFSGTWNCEECSATCGGGTQKCSQDRTCINPPCEGSADTISITRYCNIEPCPVDGGWSDWYRGECTECDNAELCRSGYSYGQYSCSSYRFCNNPAPAHGGANCEGEDTRSTTEICIPSNCPVNGGWSVLGSDKLCGACSVTCGTGTRTCWSLRTCNNPAPAFGGDYCQGSPLVEDTEECDAGECAVSAPAPDCRVKCASVPDGLMVRFPHETDCSRYYVCYNGASFLQTCAPGTYWNDAKQTCDLPENVRCEMCPTGYIMCEKEDGGVECADFQTGCPSGTNEIVFGGGSTIGDEEDDAGALQCGEPYETRPDGTTDCGGYFWCLNFRLIHIPCPNGTIFNKNSGRCDRGECIADGFPVRCTHEETWADDTDGTCMGYIVCDNQQLIYMSCAPGTRYHPEWRNCTYREDVDCPTDTTGSEDCEGRDNGETFAHAQCNKYNECVLGQLIERDCPPDTPLFNPEIGVCVFPEDSPCRTPENISRWRNSSP